MTEQPEQPDQIVARVPPVPTEPAATGVTNTTNGTNATNVELTEVVDANNVVVAIVPRERVRAERLRHRTAFVVVRSSRGEVLAHQRAFTKSTAPGEWDLGFGGAVEVGESYEAAAARELAEEAGIATPLRFLCDYVYDGTDSLEVGKLYETTSDGPFVHPASEVADSTFVDVAGLDHFVATHQLCQAALDVIVELIARVR